MNDPGVWATANPVCFTILALPVCLGSLFIMYKLLKAMLTNTW